MDSLKFYIGDFYENLLRKSRFGYDPAKVLGTLHEDLSTFYYYCPNIKLPYKCCLQVKRYQAVSIAKEV
jgi:hypothetical protein